MDDKEFNTELKKLLKDASDTAPEPYYLTVEKEKGELVAAFNDHYATLSIFEGDISVQDFLDSLEPTEVAVANDETAGGLPSMLCIDLDELMQKEIEKYPIMLDGEMHVSGEGIYIIETDEQSTQDADIDDDIRILEDGATLTGDTDYYSVESMISYEAFVRTQHADDLNRPDYDDVPTEAPSPLLHMKNVKVTDENGKETTILSRVIVPLNYSSFQFAKVFRNNIPEPPEFNGTRLSVDIIDQFKGDFINKVYREIERVINTSESEGEELHTLRAFYQLEVANHMAVVDKNRKIVLTALDVLTYTGKFIDITDQEITYLDPVIVQLLDNSWRIAHSVEISTPKGLLLCHILPEDILDIHYGIEE